MAVLGAAILVATLLGPFGSFATPLAARLGYWALFLVGGYACFRPVVAAGRALADQTGLPRSAAIAVACLLGALPTSLIVVLAFAGFRSRQVTVGDLAVIYPQVLIVGGTITIVQLLAHRPRSAADAGLPASDPIMVEEAAPPPTAPDEPPRPASFLDLLPPHLGREVICLENEDHYIRAYTPLGNALILMRMRDAVAQLDGHDGERVHRGWWVARRVVVGVVRQDRNVRLKLADGREIPVARSSVAALRSKGWLSDQPGED